MMGLNRNSAAFLFLSASILGLEAATSMVKAAAADCGGEHPPQEYLQKVEDRFETLQLGDEDAGFGSIPVIDVKEKRENVVREVAEACREWGFFQAVNHGVPVYSTQGALQVAGEFFDMPYEDKQSYNDLAKKFLVPDQSLAANQLINYSEGGVTHIPGAAIDWRDSLRLNYLVKQYNVWPEKPSSFKDVMKEYMGHVRQLTQDVLNIIAEGLGITDSGILQAKFGDEPRHYVQLNYFPPFHKPELVKGIPAHSDLGGITVLLQDSVGGLEIWKQGRWLPVRPIENAFVVNLGDQLEVLTNGEYKSVNHRVRVNSQKERFSIASFYGPSADAKIAPLPELVSETKPPLYRECVTKDYIAYFFSHKLDGKTSLDYLKISEW